MSKALVIKGANFSANKIETVTIGESVPCTGILLSESAIALDTLNETVTLVATLTPSNTTDNLSWASSNENVATVADGVVTCVGVGSATVTATCGSQTATCSVTASHIIMIDQVYSHLDGYRYSGSIDYSAVPVKDHIGVTAITNGRLFYDSTNTLDGYRLFITNSSIRELMADKYPIPIPQGTTKITVTVPTTYPATSYRISGAICNANEKQTYIGGTDGNSAKGLLGFTQNSGGGTVPKIIDISEYPTANGFFIAVVDGAHEDASNISNIEVKFEGAVS